VRKGWLWLSIGGLVVLFVVVFVVLYLLGGHNESALTKITEISIVFLALSMVLVVLLLGALVGASVWLIMLLKDKVIPLLEQLTAAAARVRGTAEFVGEEVAAPIISAYSTLAGIRAMIKTVTGTDHKK
jgi:hypothetical protein